MTRPIPVKSVAPLSPFANFANLMPPMPAMPPMASMLSNNPMFAMFGRAGEAWARAGQAWQQEIIRFTTARFESDSAFGQRLAACKDWTDASKVQQEWAAALTQDLIDETTRLTQLASTLGGALGTELAAATDPSPQRKSDAA